MTSTVSLALNAIAGVFSTANEKKFLRATWSLTM